MRLRQLTGELRGRDMELGRVLEDKMRLLVEILEEVGVDTGLPPVSSKFWSGKVLTRGQFNQHYLPKLQALFFVSDIYVDWKKRKFI